MTDYYIDPANGSNANDGTAVTDAWEDFAPIDSYDSPKVTLGPGDRVLIRDTGTVTGPTVDLRDWDGTDTAPIVITNYQDESPVIDFSNETFGFDLRANGHIIIENLTARNTDEDIVNIRNGAHDHVIRNCVFHSYGLGGTTGHGVEIRDGHDLLIENVECYDGSSGGNSDGFLMGRGSSNVTFRDCISHHNSDDGWDMKGKKGTDPGAGTLVRCLSYRNGTNLDGSMTGNGVGFKFGNDEATDGGHTFRQCVSFDNSFFGFAGPTCERSITFHNCTAVRNEKSGFYVGDGADHDFTNCISQENGGTDARAGSSSVTTCNWSGGSSNADVSVEFVSYDPTSSEFLRLPEGSQAINAGTDVGLPYSGAAPDWGAFEYGESATAEPEPSRSAILRVYDGSEWRRAPAQYYDGSQFVSL